MSVATVLRVSLMATISTSAMLLEHAALHTSRDHRAATFNVEYVFDAHQERLVHFARRQRNERVNGFHQCLNGIFRPPFSPASAALALPRRWASRARESTLVKQVADFHFDEVEQFLVVHEVNLVQVNDNGGHAHLAGQQHVFLGLGHRAFRGVHHQDGAVHLRRRR